MEEKNRTVKPWDLFNPHRPRSTLEVAKDRLEICRSCPSFFKGTSQCLECGCIMPAKVKLAEATCPLEKW